MVSSNNKNKQDKIKSKKTAIWQRFVWWSRPETFDTNSKSYTLITQAKKSLRNNRSALQNKIPDNRPWYLLIGTESGKTSSLLYSDFEPVYPNEQAISNIIKTEDIDLWEDNEKIILECSSDLFNQKKKNINKLIQDLPKTLKILHAPNGIDGIIIMLKADDFASTPEQFNRICKTISETCVLFSSASIRLPIHIIINQCSNIPGFSETFARASNTQHLLQIQLNTTNNILEKTRNEVFSFNKKFQDFITMQIIDTDDNGRIEQLILARAHFETISNRVYELVTKIDWSSNLALCNVSFCSVIKNPIIKHDLAEAELRIPEHNALIQDDDVFESTFVRNTYAQINSSSAETSNRGLILNYQPIVASLVTAAIIAACWTPIHIHFQKRNNLIKKINNSITLNSNQSIAKTILQLQNAMTYIKTHYKDRNLKNKKIYLLVSNKLQKVLQQDLANELFSTIETRLAEQTSGNSSKLYNTLKVYLMLHNLGPINSSFIENWFQADWAKSLRWGAAQQLAMTRALDQLLRSNIKNIPTANIGLIARARNSLDRLPTTVLAYNILTNSTPQGGIDLNQAVPHSPDVHLQISDIPAIYTINNADNMLNKIIPNIMLLIKKQDWVIQQNIGKKVNPHDINTFITQIRELYLNDYAQKWMQIFNGITISPAQNLQQVQSRIQQLRSPNSTLWGILNILLRNTYNDDNNSDFYKQVTSPFLGIQNLNPSNYDNNTVQTNLKSFAEYIDEIVNSKYPQKAEFNVASNKASAANMTDPISLLNNLATEQPSAIANWLSVISNGAWHSIINSTASYINDYWQKNIYSYWQSKLKDRFPLNHNSTQTINISDFNDFFAPNGKIDNFLTAYIKPFVNSQNQLWQWKKIGGLQLPLKPEILNNFIKSNLIQQMFYTENISNAQSTANITLLSVAPYKSRVTWKNGTTTTTLKRGRHKNKIIASIPSASAQSLNVLLPRSKTSSTISSSSGQWTLLQLLETAKISSTKHPNQYVAELLNNNASIKLNIKFLQNNNPLIPGLLHPFTLPQSLIN